MVRLNMLSKNFSHDFGSTANKKPEKLIWDFYSYENPISVYLDMDIMKAVHDKNKGKKMFLWLIESKKFDSGASEFIKNNLDLVLDTFEEIWTHNDELLKLDDKFKWTPAYGSYIKDFKIHEKTKKISMITSDKQITDQHKLRYNFANSNKHKIDVFGRGFNQITEKETGLNDYMFSVSIENDTYDTYFTEKILDCFATGTIPIYMGTKKVANYFNEDGIIFFDGTFDFSLLSEEFYLSKYDAIKENFEYVQEYSILDDWIYKNYLKEYA